MPRRSRSQEEDTGRTDERADLTDSHPAPPLDHVLELLHVARRLHEGEGYHVHAPGHRQREVEVGAVLMMMLMMMNDNDDDRVIDGWSP